MDAASKGLFSHKIKTPDEVRNGIGPRPRKKKVIMCHGTFDVVHPGHVRHLLYAKTKAAVLIASLTADRATCAPTFPRSCARSISPRWKWSIT